MKRRADSNDWLEVEASDVLRSLTFAPSTEEATSPGMLAVVEQKPAVRDPTPQVLHPELVKDLVRKPKPLWETDSRGKPTPIGEAVQLEIDQAIEDVLGNAFEDPLADSAAALQDFDVAPSWAIPIEGVHDTKELEAVSTSPGALVPGLKLRLRRNGWLRRTFAMLIVIGSLATTSSDARFASAFVESHARSFADALSSRVGEVARSLELL
jgi:hypothetical protein